MMTALKGEDTSATACSHWRVAEGMDKYEEDNDRRPTKARCIAVLESTKSFNNFGTVYASLLVLLCPQQLPTRRRSPDDGSGVLFSAEESSVLVAAGGWKKCGAEAVSRTLNMWVRIWDALE